MSATIAGSPTALLFILVSTSPQLTIISRLVTGARRFPVSTASALSRRVSPSVWMRSGLSSHSPPRSASDRTAAQQLIHTHLRHDEEQHRRPGCPDR